MYRYTELDVFTNTMLVFALALGIASGITAYSDALVEQALAGCQIVRDSLRDCMGSQGYVPMKGDRPDARDGWQREWLHRLLEELYSATPLENDSSSGLALY